MEPPVSDLTTFLEELTADFRGWDDRRKQMASLAADVRTFLGEVRP